MDRQTYLKRFSFAAGWYLSAAEAGDVIADYTEMLLDRSDDTALSETMGKPRQAAKLLTEKKSYRRWLAAFAGLLLARTADRRWRALYLAGLTATIISVIVTATITGMSLDLASTAFLRDYLVGLSREVVGISIFALVGFTAAGVSLC